MVLHGSRIGQQRPRHRDDVLHELADGTILADCRHQAHVIRPLGELLRVSSSVPYSLPQGIRDGILSSARPYRQLSRSGFSILLVVAPE